MQPRYSSPIYDKIPRSALTLVAAPPSVLTQNNCTAAVGLTRRQFVRFAHEGKFPAQKHGRLWAARHDDVVEALTRRPEPSPPPARRPTLREIVVANEAQRLARQRARAERQKRQEPGTPSHPSTPDALSRPLTLWRA